MYGGSHVWTGFRQHLVISSMNKNLFFKYRFQSPLKLSAQLLTMHFNRKCSSVLTELNKQRKHENNNTANKPSKMYPFANITNLLNVLRRPQNQTQSHETPDKERLTELTQLTAFKNQPLLFQSSPSHKLLWTVNLQSVDLLTVCRGQRSADCGSGGRS